MRATKKEQVVQSFLLTIARLAHKVKIVMKSRTTNLKSSLGHRSPAEAGLWGRLTDRGVMDRGTICPSLYTQAFAVKANACLGWQPM